MLSHVVPRTWDRGTESHLSSKCFVQTALMQWGVPKPLIKASQKLQGFRPIAAEHIWSGTRASSIRTDSDVVIPEK